MWGLNPNPVLAYRNLPIARDSAGFGVIRMDDLRSNDLHPGDCGKPHVKHTNSGGAGDKWSFPGMGY